MIKDRKRLLASPHYDNLSGWKKPSIILVPRKLPPSSGNLSASSADSTISNSSASSRLSPDTSETSISGITEALDGPRVLLALSLAADANVPELEAWIQWLTSGAPPEIRNLRVKYESIYHGHSTLLLVSMPVTAWTRLPPSSGFRFVDVVTSDNLIPQAMAVKAKADTVVDQLDFAKSIKTRMMKSPTAIQTQKLETVAETFGSKSLSRFDLLKGYSGKPQTTTLGPDGKKIASALGNDTALYGTSFQGDHLMVQRLLDRGAIIEDQWGYYGDVLQAASMRDHDKAVKMLFSYEVKINAPGEEYGNVLQAAASEGHDKVVELLLDVGADINAQGGYYGNALQAAAGKGHDKVVQILVKNGVNINAEGGRYGSALQAAAYGGHEEVVQILVKYGVDINAQGGYYDNALYAASHEGHEKVVQILIEHGVNINARGSN